MEEISNFDSVHPEIENDGETVDSSVIETDPGPNQVDEGSESLEITKIDNLSQLSETPAINEVPEAENDATPSAVKGVAVEEQSGTTPLLKEVPKKSVNEGANPEDEYDQISDGTFEVDENSQEADPSTIVEQEKAKVKEKQSTRDENLNDPENHQGPFATDNKLKNEDEEHNSPNTSITTKETEKEEANENDEVEKVGEPQMSAEFEEVDANVLASGPGAVDESDMLGESDMTLPTNTQKGLERRQSLPKIRTDDAENPEEPIKDESESASDNVKKTNEPTASELDSSDGNKEAKHSTTEEVTDTIDIEESKMNEPSTTGEEGVSKETGITSNPDTETSDVVGQISFVDDSNENREEAVNREQTDDYQSSKTTEDNNEHITPQATGTSNSGAIEEDEQEQDDEPVENVQEPEESDICLIPDDTETEMTEAEKEQAILARENAEKEGEEAEKVVEATNEQLSTAETSENNDANAQATEAGAETAAVEGNEGEELSGTASCGDAPDTADEPLLEEMQSGGPTGEAGSNPKIIIAWIVACDQICKQCGEKKSCGFRFKNPETAEYEFVCEQSCCDGLMAANEGKYFIRRKKFLVEEIVNDSSASADNGESKTEKEKAGGKSDDEENVKRRNADTVKTLKCLQCKENKPCKYFFRQDDELFHVCNDDCFNLLNAEEPDKFKLKRHSIRVRNIGATSLITTADAAPKKTPGPESRVVARTAAEAEAARLERVSSFTRRCADCFAEVTLGDKNLLWETMDFCNEICLGKYQRTIGSSCQTCRGEVPHQALGKYCVRFGFEIRQFCCAACLNEFKKGLKTCSCCQKDISSGNEGFLAPVGDKEQFKDFCSQSCMRRYDTMCNPKKKTRNDICAVCNNDKAVRVEIVLDEREHNFCSNPCFSAFKFVSNIVADQCGMCCKYFERKGAESFTIYTERRAKVFCSRICLNVYIIVNRKIVSCQWCKVKKYNFDMIYKQQDAQEILMCSLNCLTLYGVSINAFSRTVAKCDNCSNSATPQYHLTMSDASMRNFCTYQCVMQFQSQFARAPLTLDNNEPSPTGQQKSSQQQQQQGANSTINKNSAPFPTGLPKRVKLKVNQQQPQQQQQQQQPIQIKLPTKNANAKKGPQIPVISTVSSLASGETETMIGNVTVRRSRGRGRKIDSPPPLVPVGNPSTTSSAGRGRSRRNIEYTRSPSPVSLSPPRLSGKRGNSTTLSTQSQPQIQEKFNVQTETKIVTVPPYPPAVRNVQTSCKPQNVTVGFQCEPNTRTASTQTGKDYSNKVLIPVPVPIYVPQPMYMYSAPFPVPVPIPLPIPVPIFIPTTRNSAQGILKEIKKIQDKMPADPFEAELLMMAEMVAEEKHESDSGSEDEIKPDPGVVSLQYDNVQPVEVTNNAYGEDVLQMALKLATGEYDQPTVDLESAMTANTITNPPPGMVVQDDSLSHMTAHHMQQHHILEAQRGGRGRKRGAVATPVAPRNNRSPVKRQRLQELDESQQPQTQNIQPMEKPDANMCLKYTFGVNAWKQWVMTKNADLEKSSIRRRPFKTELLQMTADELNYSLCLFVKEVRKPNGTEYAPDTIYYLVLGVQQYLYENGRIDNIFTDPYYERFTDCLDEVARKFSVLYNDSQYIVTRVEEEHLWECKQLGAHSPHVLLSTLMFFNTKHFNLTTVEEHMQLSFSHIMKHWKRSAQNAKSAGTRNVLLRFYPPQAGLDANPRKKKVYEQQENEENPLRCPVRLYEFYLSKCPESVKTRNDVFYLQPERSCVPDSPVWYSTQALSQESLQKMLHRVKMVKEINIALLTS